MSVITSNQIKSTSGAVRNVDSLQSTQPLICISLEFMK
jgi:hypothetical protein